MKERPILFSGEMVRAILEGRKSQTRRVLKPQPLDVSCDDGLIAACWSERESPCYSPITCPYGQPGARLWVKETWSTSVYCDDRKPSDTEKPGHGYGWPVWYSADGTVNNRSRAKLIGGPGFTTKGKLRPSIFMPRWASRITLEITKVRVERLNEISTKDCIAEGIESSLPSPGCAFVYKDYLDCATDVFEWFSDPRDSYRSLWESINGRGSWENNPWVWVIEFKRI